MIKRHIFWRVRNRLFVTYLMLGLAPIILFGALTVVAAYVLAGQYATDTALRSLDIEADEVRSESGGLAMLSMMRAIPTETPVFNGSKSSIQNYAEVALAVNDGKRWRDLSKAENGVHRSAFDGLTTPPWLTAGFQGVVALSNQLYLCSENEVTQRGHSGFVLASLPVSAKLVQRMASGLGTISILPGHLGTGSPQQETMTLESSNSGGVEEILDAQHVASFRTVSGGALPAARRLFDSPVVFSAPLRVRNWDTGAMEPALIFVVSRPSLLYEHLFATSASVGDFVRYALLIAGMLALFVEFTAVIMAVGLSRTITRSVAALSRGTAEIEAGHPAVPDTDPWQGPTGSTHPLLQRNVWVDAGIAGEAAGE